MLTDRLKNFIGAWCDVDSDLDVVAKRLHQYPNDGWALWLPDELRDAIEGKDFTPRMAARLTGIGFNDQAEVDDWLRHLWTVCFPDARYPAQR